LFEAFKANGSPRESDTPSSPCEHSRYHDFVQNVAVSSDKRQEETEATKHAGNSYTNIEPAASNFTPVAPPGMCIPDCTSNESTSIDSVHVDREAAEEYLDDTTERCADTAKVKPTPLAQPVVDEVDSALVVRGQETTETIRNEEHISSADSANISKNTNEATETRMPEYMNLAVNMGHNAAKVLGAIPKKLPAPPVPPRGTSFHTV
jgi:hypothetical protein